MRDLTFLLPLIAGFVVMALAVWKQVLRGPSMNRSLAGAAFISGSILWLYSSAILLVRSGRFYAMLNVMTVGAFFLGIAFLLPRPSSGEGAKVYRTILMSIAVGGFVLGCVHAFALTFIPWWPEHLLQAYAAVGIE